VTVRLSDMEPRAAPEKLAAPRAEAAFAWPSSDTRRPYSGSKLPSPIQWRAPFQLPELTHTVEINLNRQVSLPPHPRTSTLTLPGDTPSSGTTHGASRQASSVQSAWRLVSLTPQTGDRYPPAGGATADPALRASAGVWHLWTIMYRDGR